MKIYSALIFCFMISIVNVLNSQITPTFDDVFIPMSDGDSLQVDIYIPSGVDSAQVMLVQTPYNKDMFELGLPIGIGNDLDSQPFIWIFLDWRGFYGSSEADLTDVDRGQDGYDACEWISQQSWHIDRIGTWGPSALGVIQYQTAAYHHPSHTCAVPMVAHGEQAYTSYYTGGVLEEARVTQLDFLGFGVSSLVLIFPYDNVIWQGAADESWFAPLLEIPTLQIGGWYDHNIDRMMDFYTDSRNLSAPEVQDDQWLVVGPWVHGGTGTAFVGSEEQGELSYPNATLFQNDKTWEFLNYYLLDEVNGWLESSRITYYTMGENVWNTSDQDDIADGENGVLFLRDDAALGNESSGGMTTFTSDPSDPTPTIGGPTLNLFLDQGPYDQTELDERDDVITFTSVELSEPVSITGRVKLDLFVSADVLDCDIAVRLVDQYPDGTNMLINDGIRKMRFRNGYLSSDEEFMEEGQVYHLEVELPFTSYSWQANHKIKVYISGNHASRFQVNYQDGGALNLEGTPTIGEITIHHSAEYPSRINLPGDNPVLSIHDIDLDGPILYPNPASNKVQINHNGIQVDRIEFYSTMGQLMTSFTDQSVIDVSSFVPGLYFVKVYSEDVVFQSEFVVY